MNTMLPNTILTSAALGGLWFAAVWRILVHSIGATTSGPVFFGSGSSQRRLKAVLVSVCVVSPGVLIGTPQLWHGIWNGYSGDSLFTLEPAEIGGVLAISVALIVLFFWLLTLVLVPLAKSVADAPIRRACAAVLSVIGSLLIFGIAHTLSPQIYYAYYRRIIPGLPDQWVIKTWFDWPRLADAAALHADNSLSAHLTGLVIWVIVIFVPWIFAVRWHEGQWQASPLQVGLATATLFAGAQFL